MPSGLPYLSKILAGCTFHPRFLEFATSILEGESRKNPLGHLKQDAQSQVPSIAIAVALAHQRFGAVVVALDKAIGEAHGQKVKEGENFLAPVTKGRQRLAQFFGSKAFDGSDPRIQASRSGVSRSCRIPSA
jgi:hypothetical protein